MTNYYLPFLCLLLSVGSLFSQPSTLEKSSLEPCAVTEKSPWLEAYQRGEIAAVRSTDTIVLPLRLHLVGKDNGQGFPGIDRVLTAMKLVNEDFAPLNIVFYVDGDVNYIADTEFDNHQFPVGIASMQVYNAPGVVNSYFVDNPSGACGYYASSGNAIAMADACIGAGDHTWSHELGHFFSLPHTFFGWEFANDPPLPFNTPAPEFIAGFPVEKVDGSNCLEAGDGFCDTAPDYLSFRWNCNSSAQFGSTLLDPDSTEFIVNAWPIMSYASDNCMEGFSDEQATAMRTNIASRGDLERDIPVETLMADVNELDLLFPADSAEFQVSEDLGLTLQWTAVEHADFYVVLLATNQFYASAREIVVYGETSLTLQADELDDNRRYYWRVRPVNRFNVMGDYTEGQTFRLLDIVSSNKEQLFAASVQISPNPVRTGSTQLTIILSQLADSYDVNLSLVDMTGKTVRQQKKVQPNAGSITQQFELSGLPAGIYVLRLQQGDRMLTRKVVIGS